jgi:membrane protein YdbS with pleckstrin-like domain
MADRETAQVQPARASGRGDFIDKYLLPSEGSLILQRPHPAVLTAPATAVVGGLLAAATVSQIPRIAGPVAAVWALWLFLLVRLVLAVFNWLEYWFVVTEKRILVVSGISTRAIMATPLPELGNVSFRRTAVGRLMGYGTIILGADSKTGSVIDFAPYPEQIYLEICNIIARKDNKDKVAGCEPSAK